MSVANAAVKITSVLHGTTDLGSIKRVRIVEEAETLDMQGSGTTNGPVATPRIRQGVRAEVVSEEPTNYVATGASGSLVVNFLEADEVTTGSLTVTAMRRLGQEWNFEHNTEPEHMLSFKHEGAMASTPITIT